MCSSGSPGYWSRAISSYRAAPAHSAGHPARALELFDAEGYEAVMMAAIARAAEVGERTGYRYFTDKEVMLLAEDAPH